MKKWVAGLVACIVLGFGMSSAVLASAEAEEKQAVIAAVEQFYAALNALFVGNAEPMKAVWSHAEDVTYMGPGGGFQIGWVDIRAQWDEQAAKKLGGKVVPDQMQVNIGKDISLTHNYEVGENVDKSGNPQKVSIRATNIFRKENGSWKMIGHHTDLLPFLNERG